MQKQYSMFVGRYQCFHNGHKHIIDTELHKGKSVLIAIRDVMPDDKNIFTATQVQYMIECVYACEVQNGTVKTMIIPDISCIMYGRGVGYDVQEIIAPAHIQNISATDIRHLIAVGAGEWKNHVPSALHNVLDKMHYNAVSKKGLNKFIPSRWLWRTVCKAITYRMMGTTTTVLVSLVITGHLATSLTIGCIEAIIKIGNYTIHEWLWKGKK